MEYFFELAAGYTAGVVVALAFLATVYTAVEYGPWDSIRDFLGDAIGALGLVVLACVLFFAAMVY